MKIDEFGRRLFFLYGLALMILSALTLIISTSLLLSSSKGGGGGSDDDSDDNSTFLQGLVVIGCIGYTVAYQLSFGPGVFILGR
jgi:hypothetical protein